MIVKQRFHFIHLAYELAKTDLSIKYSRTMFGWSWIFIYPLTLLGIYTAVFSGILHLSWTNKLNGEVIGYVYPFAIGLFVYLFSVEILSNATTIFLNKKNYVLRSFYPLWAIYLSLVFRAAINLSAFFIILLVVGAVFGYFDIRNVFLGLFILLVGGGAISVIGFILAMIGPFLPDMTEIVRLIVRVLFYASPISYPLSIVPEQYRGFLLYNPIAVIIENLRSVLIYDSGIEIYIAGPFILLLGMSIILCIWLYSRLGGVIADAI